jgi:hypothetical protein
VRRQIFRRARRRAAHQIIRCSHGDHALRAADAHRHHVGLDAFTQPHAGVEARRNDVGQAVVEREFEPDLRVAHGKTGQMRRDQQTVGDARHVDAHGAGSLAARLRQRFERTAQLLQPDPHAVVEAFAFFGQRHAARGAGQQAHAQPLFQTTDRLRQRRRDTPISAAAREKLVCRATHSKAVSAGSIAASIFKSGFIGLARLTSRPNKTKRIPCSPLHTDARLPRVSRPSGGFPWQRST